MTELLVSKGMRRREAKRLAAKYRDGEIPNEVPPGFDPAIWLDMRERRDVVVVRPDPVAHNARRDWRTTTTQYRERGPYDRP